ncbi:MAG: hypothetical protein GY755_02615 [Chloroflexi bacterium]|nr:hypothetical protein [Chloroflexota bacterium]
MKKHHPFLLAALFLFFLSSCVPLTPVPPSVSAVIGEVENDVSLKKAEEAPFEKAFVNDEIEVNDQVKTSEDSRSRIDLSSGTVIRVSPNSLFILEENYEKEQDLLTRIKIETGRIWIVLNGGSLEVETSSGLAGVRGSYMSTGYDPESGDVRITCLEGHCAAENESGAVEFTAGEAADLPADGASPVKGEMTDEEFQMWADNVPEAKSLLPAELFMTPTPEVTESTPTPTLTPTPMPELGACTVTSTYLYIRSCADSSCDTLGYAELDDTLDITQDEAKEGWISVIFEGEIGWINAAFCE